MDLTFSENNGVFVADFEATADFNLHIEGAKSSDFTILQSGVQGGAYDVVRDAGHYPSSDVYDNDFVALVYPKYMRIVSSVRPTLAVVTFNA